MHDESEAASLSGLRIRLFGAFDARIDDIPIPPLRSRKVQWLLALLALRHEQALDRAWLAGVLWPESARDQAMYNLRQSLSNLRQALGKTGQCLHASMVNALSLEIAADHVDVLAFDAAIPVGDGAALERAVALYRGPLLEGCAEDWVFAERRVRAENYLSALEKLAAIALDRGEGSAAVTYLRAAIQTDPFRERAQRALIQALAQVGDYGAAVQTYRDLRLLLRRELNADPDPETVALFQHIQREARLMVAVPPSLPATPAPSTPTRQLPCPLTRLVGRKSELEQAVAALRTARLLTLTGPGGVGKTRLAIAVAEQMAETYPDGAFFVDLAPLSNPASDPALIAQTVVTALQAREEPGRSPQSTLQRYLHAKTLLLLLDNCEHLLDACAGLANAILQTCAGVSILATSRQALGLTGEVIWTVPPLSAPTLTDLASRSRRMQKERLSLLSEYEAVQLFVVRAQQALPAFQLSARNAHAVAQICAHLDGNPLALELAAARVRSLAVEEINARLDNRFRLLTGGSRAALPRQQTLRALMDWSYDLLNAQEKTLLRRVAVFAGGWTLQAVERVCSEEVMKPVPFQSKWSGEERIEAWESIEEWEILDLLTSLVDKNLVVAEQEAGRTRYRLLETVRQYALERLEESGESDRLRHRHQGFFLDLSEAAEPRLQGPQQAAWLEQLEREHDNFRQALGEGSQEAALRIAGALWRFLLMRGYFTEGREWIAGALAGKEVQDGTLARAKALHGAGVLTWSQGDYTAAQTLHEESLIQYRALGNRAGVADALHSLGNIEAEQGNYTVARTLYTESLVLRRDLGDKTGTATLLNNLGSMAHNEGDSPAAQPLHEESLALRRDLGDKAGIASSLNNLANVVWEQGDNATARALYTESLSISRDLGNTVGIANSLYNLGGIAYEQEDYAEARSLQEGSLLLFQELGKKPSIAASMGVFAALALEQKQMKRAARLWGAAEALREEIGAPMPPSEQEEYVLLVERGRAALNERAFTEAWAEGRHLTLEQAIEYALEEGSI